MQALQRWLKFDIAYVAKNGSWLMLGQVVAMAGVLATSYVFANYLSPETYGQYKYFLSLGALLSTVSLTGIGLAITQAAAKDVPGFFSLATKLSLRYGLIVSAVSLLGAGYYLWQGNTQLAMGLALIAFLQPLLNNSTLIYSYLGGKEQFSLSTKGQMIRSVVTSIALIMSALLFLDPLVLLGTYFVTHLAINYAIRFWIALPREAPAENQSETRSLIRYAKHTSLRNVFTNVAQHIDKVLIFQNLSAADLAVYAFAIALPEQIKRLTKSIQSLLFARFSKRSAKDIKSNMWRKTWMYLGVLTLIVTIYIFSAPYLFELLFPDYTEAIFLSQLYSLGLLTWIASIPITGLNTLKANQILYKIDLIFAISQITLLLILVLFFNLMGAVIAKLVSRAIHLSITYFYFSKLET